MNIKRVKQGAKITFWNGVYMILFGLILIIFVKSNMMRNFKSFDQLWGFFQRYNPDIAYLFWLYNIIVGIFLISEGIVIMYLSDFILKRKEKMTWVVLFLSGIISWAGLLTVSIMFKNNVLILMSLFGWATFILGMLLPIRYYIEKNYREY